MKNFKIYPARDWWTTILPWYKLLKKSMFTKIYSHCFQIVFLPFQKSWLLTLTRKRTRAKPLYQGNQRYDKNNYRKLMLAGVKHMKSRDFAWWMAKLKLFQSKVHVHEYPLVLKLSWITREIKHIFVPQKVTLSSVKKAGSKKQPKKSSKKGLSLKLIWTVNRFQFFLFVKLWVEKNSFSSSLICLFPLENDQKLVVINS